MFNSAIIHSYRNDLVDLCQKTNCSEKEMTFIVRLCDCYTKLISFVPMTEEEIETRITTLTKMLKEKNIDRDYVDECCRNARNQLDQTLGISVGLKDLSFLISDCYTELKFYYQSDTVLGEKMAKLKKLIEDKEVDLEFVKECLKYIEDRTAILGVKKECLKYVDDKTVILDVKDKNEDASFILLMAQITKYLLITHPSETE